MPRKFDLQRSEGPGKFEASLVIDEVAYELALCGCDEQESHDNGGGWYGLLRGPFRSEGSFVDITPTMIAKHELTKDELDCLASVRGCIIWEDSQGFVDVEWYTNKRTMERAWKRVERSFRTTDND